MVASARRERAKGRLYNWIALFVFAIMVSVPAYFLLGRYYSDEYQSKVEFSRLQVIVYQDRYSDLVGHAVIVEKDSYRFLRVDADNGRDRFWIMLNAKSEPFVKSMPDIRPFTLSKNEIDQILAGPVNAAVKETLMRHVE